MLEQETTHILQTLIARSIGSREAISLRQILATDLPRGVKSYLRAEVHQWLMDDLTRAPHFSRIQSSDPAATRHLDVFVRSMGEHYVYMRSQYLTALEHAVLFTLNYLCRPHRTLHSFFFSSIGTMTVDTLRAKARFVTDYQYLFSILDRIIVQRGAKEIDEAEFSALLLDIDRRVTREHGPRELAVLAKPVFDFLLMRTSTPTATIPLRPIIAFFEDKGMDEAADYIEKVCHIRARTDISLKVLAELLEDLMGPVVQKGPALPLPPEQPASTGPEPLDAAQPQSTSGEELAATPPAGEEPQAPPQIEMEQPHPSEIAVEQPMDGKFQDIREIIAADQRQRFIRTICGRDEAFYEALMLKFNSMKLWSDASAYLRDIFVIHGIDPFSPVAVELTDVLQHRFSEEGKGQE
jgi:hypothetical protein